MSDIRSWQVSSSRYRNPLGGQSHHGSQATASSATASSTLDNYPILIGNSSKHGKKKKSSHLLRIHWLCKHSVRILPAESNSNKQKNRAHQMSKQKIPFRAFIKRCEIRTSAASRESSPAHFGRAAESSARSLNRIQNK
jgi:hypothetical protein